MPIFMKYEGIIGEVTEKPHEGWVELQSAQIGTARNNAVSPNRASKEVAWPSVSEITITKLRDSTSTQFFRASLWGEGKKAIIDFVDKDGMIYLRLELKDTLISSYNVGNSAHGTVKPFETLSLNFSKITYTQPTPIKDPKHAGQLMEFQTVRQNARAW